MLRQLFYSLLILAMFTSAYAESKSKGIEYKIVHRSCQPNCWQALQNHAPAAVYKQSQSLQKRLLEQKSGNVALLYRQEKETSASPRVLAVQTSASTWFADWQLGSVQFYQRDGKGQGTQMDRYPLRGKHPMTSGFKPKRRHPITGKVRPHYGVDWTAPRGTPVYSTAAGVVSFAGRQRGYGNIVIIQHENGYESRYAHLNRIRVQQGQRVKRGQHIGGVGRTGAATGTHLHYEVRINGTPYDPLKVRLPAAKALPSNRMVAWRVLCQQRLQQLNELKKRFPAR